MRFKSGLTAHPLVWPIMSLLISACFFATGCERKKPIVKVEAPGTNVEVNKTSDGSVEVEVEKK